MPYPHRPPSSLKLIAPAPQPIPPSSKPPAGDDQAFARLVEPFRSELSAHCYRMLGSAHDAEDALQEAMLRAWRGLPKFEGRSSLRSGSTRFHQHLPEPDRAAAQARAADRLRRHRRPARRSRPAAARVGLGRALPGRRAGLEDGYAAPEARYELRESVELAFVAALQNLPANQRAVLILREVLGFSAAEVAEALDTSVASVNSALQRARKTVDEKLPDESQQATLRSLDDQELREIVESYMDAMERGDVEAVMEPAGGGRRLVDAAAAGLVHGTGRAANVHAQRPLSGDWRWRHIPTQANGQPAVGSYAWYEPDQAYRLFAIDVFTLAGSKIKAITSFINRSTLSREELFYQRYPEQPMDDSNTSVQAEAFGLPEPSTDR